MTVVEVRELYKSFRRLRVLKGLSFSAKEGEVVAILGPNASGKSTLLKSLLGLVKPDSGYIKILGEEVRENYEYKGKLGYMPQEPKFPHNITPNHLLRLVSKLRGFFPDENVERLKGLFRLEAFMEKPVHTLSGGTRQKINALIAFAFEPPILILDEPTAGLDPLSSSKLKDEILRLKEKGTTILLTSHIMSEVEELADRIILLIEGSLKVNSNVTELKRKLGASTLEKALALILEEEGV